MTWALFKAFDYYLQVFVIVLERERQRQRQRQRQRERVLERPIHKVVLIKEVEV